MKIAVLGAGLLVACAGPPVAKQAEPDLVVPPMPSAKAAAAPTPSLPPAKADPNAKRAKQVIEHPEWLGTAITVEIYEPLWDSGHSSAADDGCYDVHVSDVGPSRFEISPGSSPAEVSAGALPSLATDLRPPLRVRGVLGKSRNGLRLIAHEVEQLSFPAPTRLTNAQLLIDEPAKWSGRYVEVEDTWLRGFEASFVGKTGVWLDLYPSATLRCEPPRAATRGRSYLGPPPAVRIVGYAYTGGHYGHLGSGQAELIATEIVFLDPKRAECR